MKKNSRTRNQKIDQLAEKIRHLQAIYGALRREYYVTLGEKVDAIIDRATLEEIREAVGKIRAKYFQDIDTEAIQKISQSPTKEQKEEGGKVGENE